MIQCDALDAGSCQGVCEHPRINIRSERGLIDRLNRRATSTAPPLVRFGLFTEGEKLATCIESVVDGFDDFE
jgi:hypothetical protein